MRDTTDTQHAKPDIPGEEERSTLSRLLWFAGLYIAGVVVVMAVAWFFRALLGMH